MTNVVKRFKIAGLLAAILLFSPALASRAVGGERWFTDLTQAKPASAIRRDGAEASWIAVDYELTGRDGVMLFATPETKSPPLTLALGVTGWHKIYLGIYYGYGPGG